MNTENLLPFHVSIQKNLFIHAFSETPAQNKFAEHRHVQFEFFLLLQGEVEMIVDNTAFDLRENDFLIIPAGVAH